MQLTSLRLAQSIQTGSRVKFASRIRTASFPLRRPYRSRTTLRLYARAAVRCPCRRGLAWLGLAWRGLLGLAWLGRAEGKWASVAEQEEPRDGVTLESMRCEGSKLSLRKLSLLLVLSPLQSKVQFLFSGCNRRRPHLIGTAHREANRSSPRAHGLPHEAIAAVCSTGA